MPAELGPWKLISTFDHCVTAPDGVRVDNGSDDESGALLVGDSAREVAQADAIKKVQMIASMSFIIPSPTYSFAILHCFGPDPNNLGPSDCGALNKRTNVIK